MPTLPEIGAQLAQSYRSAAPFPHGVMRNFWSAEDLAALAAEVKAFKGFDGTVDHAGSREKRFCSTYERLPPLTRAAIDRCHAPDFVAFLEALSGFEGLVGDPALVGGGLHSNGPGAFLKIHADFSWHADLGMYRRINLLLYLNPDWQAEWGGALELWSRDMSKAAKIVLPELGTMVVFNTDDQSFHGHPEPLRCPDGVTRDSIALYFYSPPRSDDEQRAARQWTDYRRRPGGEP